MRTSPNLILLILLTSFICYSQTTGIKGIVFDGEFNEPMPFANIFIKGTEIGSVTDFDGNYTLEVVEGTYTLVVSFVGYETKEIFKKDPSEEDKVKEHQQFQKSIVHPKTGIMSEKYNLDFFKQNEYLAYWCHKVGDKDFWQIWIKLN